MSARTWGVVTIATIALALLYVLEDEQSSVRRDEGYSRVMASSHSECAHCGGRERQSSSTMNVKEWFYSAFRPRTENYTHVHETRRIGLSCSTFIFREYFRNPSGELGLE